MLKSENKNGEGKRFIKDDPKKLQVTPTYVYLTFDDGPNDGTDVVLDALKAEGVNFTNTLRAAFLYVLVAFLYLMNVLVICKLYQKVT